jgi:RNA-directed DNA polymerase
MTAHRSGETLSPKLMRVVDRAKRDPNTRFTSLAHLLDVDALRRAFARIDEDAAVGVDGVTKGKYREALEDNLQNLHERMRAGEYRHQPIRRVHIPKENGKTRPIGVSCVEDKIVQGALSKLLGAICEQDFRDCSFGFRPGRSQHDALKVINNLAVRGKTGWILEADIKSFFDSLDHSKLKEMLQERIADKSVMRLVGKCLRVGVLDGNEFTRPIEGTAQGSIISPLLGNVYLHHVLDLWFQDVVVPRLRGCAHLVRYADDFVIGFERREDAEAVLRVLPKRLGRYGLTLQSDKTRLFPFHRPSRGQTCGKGPATFDFLGFTIYWMRGRRGAWRTGFKTRAVSFRRAVKAISEWCRSHRHLPLRKQHAGLAVRLRGHFNYFAVSGNSKKMYELLTRATRIWLFWLRRRSQRRGRLTWERFNRYLLAFPLPKPRIQVRIWGAVP